jgi:glycosyltransferase involved in cell wall biosynthesis
MLNINPKVSVVMTVFNARNFVGGAIDSILSQTYRNLELIIVDDGSTDGSARIVNELAKRDSRIKLLFLRKNHGPCYASNVGIKEAKGIYLARMDADDISLPDRLENQVRFLQLHPEVAMLGGQCKLIDKNGKFIGEKLFPLENNDITRSLFSRNPIQHPACMINLKKLTKPSIFNDGKSVLAHDLELIFLASKYGKLANLKVFVLEYRQYPESFSLKDPKKTYLATLIVRLQSILKYGYKPTFAGILTTIAQTLIVSVLPGNWIYPIYTFIRGMRKPGVRINFDANFLLQKAYRLVRA